MIDIKKIGRFDYVPATEEQKEKYNAIRNGFETLERVLGENCPDGDYLDRALEELEIVSMLSSKAISRG